MVVAVLGAGASRGASFVQPKSEAVAPPLDSDFFHQLQRIEPFADDGLIAQVIRDVAQLFGVGSSPTLERVFTTVEHTLRIIEVGGDKLAIQPRELRQIRKRLLQAIAFAFGKVFLGADGKHQACDYHRDLIAHLTPNDRILSFNYDCLIDECLKRYGNDKWNPVAHGYGIKVTNASRWASNVTASSNETLRLYKLHGSLHFSFNSKGVISLRRQPYRTSSSTEPVIVPPEWNKRWDERTWSRP